MLGGVDEVVVSKEAHRYCQSTAFEAQVVCRINIADDVLDYPPTICLSTCALAWHLSTTCHLHGGYLRCFAYIRGREDRVVHFGGNQLWYFLTLSAPRVAHTGDFASIATTLAAHSHAIAAHISIK
jgi:hypothetical protein